MNIEVNNGEVERERDRETERQILTYRQKIVLDIMIERNRDTTSKTKQEKETGKTRMQY